MVGINPTNYDIQTHRRNDHFNHFDLIYPGYGLVTTLRAHHPHARFNCSLRKNSLAGTVLELGERVPDTPKIFARGSLADRPPPV
ncbi:hypothetical protein SAMN05216226_102169 [Halovenus aranensis]|uniref:Uncharacterized protein n=1 Tax=Halovenus aranensis TaxID=890420 RepID=A0A1G8SVT1_9EURY|nr:hypothetical protein SAMN05216226_102169 [Halovenus aranensis]